MPNQLQFEKSPYLLQHKHNPVNWLPWDRRAFEAAQSEDKPIFLSIGYSTCHWCHVMAHESFEDETVAEALNRSFVSIKVDREERPDVDGVYMSACLAMTGSGGWPLTVLMTPDQKPFWAGTYLPKDALLSLLEQGAWLWQTERDRVRTAGEDLTRHLQQEEAQSGSPKRETVSRAAKEFARSFDKKFGGFGKAPKFPTPHNLLFLMGYAQRTGDAGAMDMAEKTLEAMYRGGLFDHVGGGFSRYSTDRQWLVPHFEKMLYDNALLTLAYTQAYQITRRPLYKTVVNRTVDYVLRDLTSEEGGFYCGQDADSEGVEGKYYVFTPQELHTVLGKEAGIFCRRYGVTEKGNFEGHSIPNLIDQRDFEKEPEEMEGIREQLRQYRYRRTQLHKDDKILTSWNGLMIAALARAGLICNCPDYCRAAEAAAAFIRQNLTDSEGRLLARWRDGQANFAGKLEDYAFLAWGLLELYGVTFRTEYLSEACRLAAILLEFFFDQKDGGLYPYASDGEQLIVRAKEVYDGAMPSGNAVAALVFSRLSRLTGEVRWQQAARLQLSYLSGAVEAHPSAHSFTMLTLLEELWPSGELVCTCREVPEALIGLLRQGTGRPLCVLVKTPENQKDLSALAPFTADYPIPDQGERYYLCQNGACAKPVAQISELMTLLSPQT